jgi:hypothetical protein
MEVEEPSIHEPEKVMHGKNKKAVGQNLTAAAAAGYTEFYKQGSNLVLQHIHSHDQEPAPARTKEAELREGHRCNGPSPSSRCHGPPIG